MSDYKPYPHSDDNPNNHWSGNPDTPKQGNLWEPDVITGNPSNPVFSGSTPTNTIVKPLTGQTVETPVEPKKWYESKVFWFNLVTFLILVLEGTTGILQFPENWVQYITYAVLVLNMVLRVYFTNTPVGTVKE